MRTLNCLQMRMSAGTRVVNTGRRHFSAGMPSQKGKCQERYVATLSSHFRLNSWLAQPCRGASGHDPFSRCLADHPHAAAFCDDAHRIGVRETAELHDCGARCAVVRYSGLLQDIMNEVLAQGLARAACAGRCS